MSAPFLHRRLVVLPELTCLNGVPVPAGVDPAHRIGPRPDAKGRPGAREDVDPTSHGGKVSSVAATHFTVGGTAVARVGDKVTCPLHGNGKIIEGDKHYTIDRIPVTFEGHKASCGAVLTSTVTNFGRG